MQVDLVDDCGRAFGRGHRRILAVACTGFGKTPTFGEVIRRTLQRGGSVVVMAHRVEIVLQIAAMLSRMGIRFGWVMPGKPMVVQAVMLGMVQSVANRLDKLPQPKLLVIDEAHHATAGTYRKISDAWQGCFILGVTATPMRTDGSGLGSCFDTMVLAPPMRELISRGYLADYRYFRPPPPAELLNVKTRAGDYALDELAAVMDKSSITGSAIESYREHLSGKSAIVFCVSVEHAKHVAAQFAAAGIRAASVDGATDPAERANRIAAIGDGRLQILTSCDIISEGTDIPSVAGAILLRPTKSLIIFLQQCGRVLRVKADGSKAVILDHVGSVSQVGFGLPDSDREWNLHGRPQRSPATTVMTCPKCYAAHRPTPRCPSCDHVYATAAARVRRQIEQREGKLEEIARAEAKQFGGRSLQDALKHARSLGDADARHALAELQRALGYKPGWVTMQMELRRKFRLGAGMRSKRAGPVPRAEAAA